VTPYYADDLVTLYHGRCEDVLPTLGAFDLIFTSPPYNQGISPSGGIERQAWYAPSRTGNGAKFADGYGTHDDAMPPHEYEAWQRQVILMLWDHTSAQGAVFYNHKPRIVHKTYWTPLVLNPGLPLRQVIVWARGGGMGLGDAHYAVAQEWLLVFAKPGWRLVDRGASAGGDVWRTGYVDETDNPHPAAFPVALPYRAMRDTIPGPVLDPFCGSGSTLVAAKRAGRVAVGVELEERWCELTANRCRAIAGSQEVLGFPA
jgi:DNA modification methylase